MVSKTHFYFYQGRNETLIFIFSLALPPPHPTLHVAAVPSLPEPGYIDQHAGITASFTSTSKHCMARLLL